MTIQTMNQAIGDVDPYYVSDADSYLATYKQRRRKKRKPVLLIAAILAVLMALGVGATLRFGLDKTIADFLGITPTKWEITQKMVCDIHRTKYADDMAITVSQVYGDPYFAYISVVAQIPYDIPEEGRLDAPSLDIDGADGSYHFAYVGGSEDGRVQRYVVYLSGYENLIGRRIRLGFNGYTLLDNPMVSPITEKVEFDFKIDYENITTIIPVEQTFGEHYVHHVRISPLSVILRIHDLPQDDRLLKDVVINMKDGICVDVWKRYNLTTRVGKKVNDICAEFSEVIDPRDIASVTFSVDGETYHTVEIP